MSFMLPVMMHNQVHAACNGTFKSSKLSIQGLVEASSDLYMQSRASTIESAGQELEDSVLDTAMTDQGQIPAARAGEIRSSYPESSGLPTLKPTSSHEESSRVNWPSPASIDPTIELRALASGDASKHPLSNAATAEATLKAKLSRKRTKTGCLTCRKRRIKCDEARPTCKNCFQSKRLCEGYNQRVIFKSPLIEHHSIDNETQVTVGTNRGTQQNAVPPPAKADSYTDGQTRPRLAEQQRARTSVSPLQQDSSSMCGQGFPSSNSRGLYGPVLHDHPTPTLSHVRGTLCAGEHDSFAPEILPTDLDEAVIHLSPAGASSLSSKPSKKSPRQKKIVGGFPCRKACGKCFDRECDETKHFERHHLEAKDWPHGCLYCPKRSQYPKDVWRHLEQTHEMRVPPKESTFLRKHLGCPCCSKLASDWLAEHNQELIKVGGWSKEASSMDNLEVRSKSSFEGFVTRSLIWILVLAFVKFRKLKSRRKEIFIMVTSNEKDFVKVDVTGMTASEYLLERVTQALRIDTQAWNLLFHEYSQGALIGEAMDLPTCLNAVLKKADPAGSLRLLIKRITPDTAISVPKFDFSAASKVPVHAHASRSPVTIPPSPASLETDHRAIGSRTGVHGQSDCIRQPAAVSCASVRGRLTLHRGAQCRTFSTPPGTVNAASPLASTPRRARSMSATQHYQSRNGQNDYSTTANASLSSDVSQERQTSDHSTSRRYHDRSRRSDDDDVGNGDDDDRDHKRQRRLPVDKWKQARLPCIFYVGLESARYQHKFHQKKHEHISELLRHLRSHGFYACSKCLAKFDDDRALREHAQEPCVKSCMSSHCKRYCPADGPRPFECACINTSEERWEALFRLQYPEIPVPQVFGNAISAFNSEAAGFSNLSPSDDFDLDGFLAIPNPDMMNFNETTRDSCDDTSGTYQNPSPTSNSEALALRKQILELEEKLSKASESEKNRGLAIELLYDALRRTNSSDAEPDSATSKIVQQLAPNVLRITATSTTMAPRPQISTGIEPITPSTFNWSTFSEASNEFGYPRMQTSMSNQPYSDNMNAVRG